jgi:hypothetical protein
MIGKIFRYTFIALVFLALFAFIFKLDDIVGGMPIKAKPANFTIPKASQTITAPGTVKPTATTPVTMSPAKSSMSTPMSTPTTASQQQTIANDTPAPTPVASQKDPTPSDPNRNYYDQWGNEFTYNGMLIQTSCPTDPNTPSGPNPYCTGN